MSDFEFDAIDMSADTDDIGLDGGDSAEGFEGGMDTCEKVGGSAVEYDYSDDFYHAERMSEEEVQRIDDLWDDSREFREVEPYKAISQSGMADIGNDVLTIEERFSNEIDAMSLDELQAERDRLEAIAQMNDMDIFAEYDQQQQANDLIGSMSKEQLLDLKDSVEAHDPQTLDFFGIDSDDTADAPKLSLKKRL